MGVERVDYYSDGEYEQALEQEAQPDPDIVPCFKCGGQMYQESTRPEDNICENCFMKGR